LVNNANELPNTNGNGEMDPLEADNVNIVGFLKPIFDELLLVTESFARQRQFLEEEKGESDGEAGKAGEVRKSSGVKLGGNNTTSGGVGYSPGGGTKFNMSNLKTGKKTIV
jgi:hypothetical protein